MKRQLFYENFISQDEDSDSGQKEEITLSDSFESDVSDIEVRLQSKLVLYYKSWYKYLYLCHQDIVKPSTSKKQEKPKVVKRARKAQKKSRPRVEIEYEVEDTRQKERA